jgi:hypothetical protein
LQNFSLFWGVFFMPGMEEFGAILCKKAQKPGI